MVNHIYFYRLLHTYSCTRVSIQVSMVYSWYGIGSCRMIPKKLSDLPSPHQQVIKHAHPHGLPVLDLFQNAAAGAVGGVGRNL